VGVVPSSHDSDFPSSLGGGRNLVLLLRSFSSNSDKEKMKAENERRDDDKR